MLEIQVRYYHHQLKYLVNGHHNFQDLIIHHMELGVMEHYGHGDIILQDNQDKIVQYSIHHQFKYLEVGVVPLFLLMEMVVVLQLFVKVMEPYGHGELMLMDNQDKIIKHNNHHLIKYLVLLGVHLIQEVKVFLQPKLMELYGHGDIIIQEAQELIIEQNIHHQFKYLVLHGVRCLLIKQVGEQ